MTTSNISTNHNGESFVQGTRVKVAVPVTTTPDGKFDFSPNDRPPEDVILFEILPGGENHSLTLSCRTGRSQEKTVPHPLIFIELVKLGDGSFGAKFSSAVVGLHGVGARTEIATVPINVAADQSKKS